MLRNSIFFPISSIHSASHLPYHSRISSRHKAVYWISVMIISKESEVLDSILSSHIFEHRDVILHHVTFFRNVNYQLKNTTRIFYTSCLNVCYHLYFIIKLKLKFVLRLRVSSFLLCFGTFPAAPRSYQPPYVSTDLNFLRCLCSPFTQDF